MAGVGISEKSTGTTTPLMKNLAQAFEFVQYKAPDLIVPYEGWTARHTLRQTTVLSSELPKELLE